MKTTTFVKVLLILISICLIVLVIGFISVKIKINSDNTLVVILRDIIVPIGTLFTLFLLFLSLRENQKTNKITMGKEIFERHIKNIDNLIKTKSLGLEFNNIYDYIGFPKLDRKLKRSISLTFKGLFFNINGDKKYIDYH